MSNTFVFIDCDGESDPVFGLAKELQLFCLSTRRLTVGQSVSCYRISGAYQHWIRWVKR